jgi:hypothetical protein
VLLAEVPGAAVAGWVEAPGAAAAGSKEVPRAATAGFAENPGAEVACFEEVAGATAAGFEEVAGMKAAGWEATQHEVMDFDLVLLISRMEATIAPQFCYCNQCNLNQVYNQHQVILQSVS